MPSERWTPAIAAASARRAEMLDTTGQVELLPKALAKRKKSELVELKGLSNITTTQ